MSAIRNTFLSNLILVVGLNVLIKPLYVLVVEANVQDRIGPDEFGLYFALLNLSFVFNILPDFGMTNWNNRLTAQWGFIPSQRLQQLGGIRILLAATYVVICLVAAIWMDYHSREIKLLLLLAFNQVIATAIQFLRSFLSGLHDFKSDSILSVLDKALLMLFVVVLLLNFPASGSFQLEYLVGAQTASYLIAFFVAFALVKSRVSKDVAPQPFVSREVLLASAPFAVLILVSMIANRQDGILIERLHSAHEAGIYAMAYRLGDTLNMFSFLFAGLLLPMFARLLNDHKSITPLFELSSKLLLTGAWMVSMAAFFYPEFTMAMMYDAFTDEAAAVLPWVMLSAFFFSLQYITGTLITASGSMRALIIIAASGLIYNFLLNLLYVPEQGALGAAKAACFMQVIVFASQLIAIQQQFAVLSKFLATRLVGFMSAVVLFGFLSRLLPFSEGIRVLAFLILCISSAFIIGTLHVGDIAALLKSRSVSTDDAKEKH